MRLRLRTAWWATTKLWGLVGHTPPLQNPGHGPPLRNPRMQLLLGHMAVHCPPPHLVQGCHAFHKYMDEVEVDVTIKRECE